MLYFCYLFLICSLIRTDFSLISIDVTFSLLNERYNQYLNCKILHGGTLTQLWPNVFGMRMKFRGNYASSSTSVPEFNWRPKKKGLHGELKGFCPLNREKIKKNLHRNLVLCLTEIWGLLVLTATFFVWSSWPLPLNGEIAEIPLGGTLKSRLGDANASPPPTI